MLVRGVQFQNGTFRHHLNALHLEGSEVGGRQSGIKVSALEKEGIRVYLVKTPYIFQLQ